MLGNKNACGSKSEEHKKKISEAHKKIGSPWLIDKKRKPFSEAHRKNISLSRKGNWVAENNPNWKGGITPINQKIRKSPEYKEWRKAVFERDDYTCQICGQIGGTLQVDHIKPFSLFPKLRFRISNGRTLCVLCHRETDTYGVN